MTSPRTLVFRLSVLGALLLLGLGLAVVALVRKGVQDVSGEFHDRNAALFRTTVEHMGDRMQSELADVPYGLFGDDRAALRDFLSERAGRMRDNASRTTARFTVSYRRRMEEEIDQSVNRSAVWLVGLLAGLLVAHGLALYGLVVRPLQRLEKATRRISKGDLSTHVDESRSDEIGSLARSFNAMVERLRESRDEITEWNRKLERRVEEARERLVQSEKMASLGRMAGGVAHEFNNMLGGILGIAEEAGHDEDLEDVRESLRVIARTAARAELVTGNLLRFARPHPARPAEPIDLPAILRDARALVEADAERRGIALAIDAPETLTLPGRSEEIHQVVLNLLVNAVRAMPEGGDLTIRARTEGGTVRIDVEDTGVGIPAEHLPHVFEPFFTSRRGTEEPGTGLGLAVAYAIVAGHGGRLDIESEVGRGTCVSVLLPGGGE
jgi:two-component system NtrC family sensor kinase